MKLERCLGAALLSLSRRLPSVGACLLTCAAALPALAQPIRPPGPLPLPPRERPMGAPESAGGWRSTNPSLFVAGAKPRAVESVQPLGPVERGVVDLYAAAAPSVAALQIETPVVRADGQSMLQQSAGSGVLWDDDGHLVTCLHVVQQAQRITVQLGDGPAQPAALVGVSAAYDVAVLRVADPSVLKSGAARVAPLRLADSRALQVGQTVYAIGSPFGLQRSLTRGVVSGLNRDLGGDNASALHNLIQTDASIQAGSSGGALLDSAGRLVGLHLALQSTQTGFVGVGFALPTHVLNRVVPQILAMGQATVPTLGFTALPPEHALRTGKPGVWVGRLVGRSGTGVLAPHNPSVPDEGDVVVAINDRPVTAYPELFEELERLGVGQSVVLKVRRYGASSQPQDRAVQLRIFDRAGVRP